MLKESTRNDSLKKYIQWTLLWTTCKWQCLKLYNPKVSKNYCPKGVDGTCFNNVFATTVIRSCDLGKLAIYIRPILQSWRSTLHTCFMFSGCYHFNTLKPRHNGRHFADDVFKCIFLNENVWILLKISLKFVPKGRINNIPALVRIMAWRRSGDKPLSEPMAVSLLTHICVTRPQWVKVRVFYTNMRGSTPWTINLKKELFPVSFIPSIKSLNVPCSDMPPLFDLS